MIKRIISPVLNVSTAQGDDNEKKSENSQYTILIYVGKLESLIAALMAELVKKCVSQAYILFQQTFLRTFVFGSSFLESKRAGVRTSGFFQQV